MSKDKKIEDQKQESKIEEPKKENEDKILIEQLKSEVSSLQKKVNFYEAQIDEINKEYVTKLTEKAKQASLLIEQQTNEIKQKLQTEFTNKAKYATESIAIEIINITNQFEIALSHTPNDPKIQNYQKGFNMFLTMLKTILNNINVTEVMVNVNDEFDPNTMECFEVENNPNVNDNHVVKIIKKGYKLYDRVIVPTLVIVSKK